MKSKYTKKLITILSYLLILLVSFFVNTFVISLGLVSGTSMSPTFADKDLIVINRVTNDYKLGDVISFTYSEENDEEAKIYGQGDVDKIGEDHLKRIVGLPGDTITIDYDINENKTKIYVNGEEVSYSNHFFENKTFILGEDEYYVLGDNRVSSLDSLYHGPIKKSQINGEVIFHIPNIFAEDKNE